MKLAVALLITLLSLGVQRAEAQSTQIKIQACNGITGTPLKKQRLLVFAGPTQHATAFHEKNFEVTTDGKGDATLVVDSSNVQWIQVFADDLTLCQNTPNDRSFNVAQIIATGLSTPNTCSKLSKPTEPGKFIVFARPATLAEKMRR